MSAGETPAMRAACATVAGRQRRSFSRALERQPVQILDPERVRERHRLERRGARGGALLALDVPAVASAHLERLAPGRGQTRLDPECL